MNIADIYEGHYLPEKTKKRRASTVAGYDSSMRLHVLPRWGSYEIEEIDPDAVQEWVDSFDRPGAAIKAYKCLRQIIRWWAKSKRLRIADPTVYVELPSMEPYRRPQRAGRDGRCVQVRHPRPFRRVVASPVTGCAISP